MSKEYATWEELTNGVQEKCVNILDKKVAPIAKEIVRRHIKTDIYDAYTPKEDGWVSKTGKPMTYKRRSSLLKRGAVYHKFTKNADEIIITSDVTASPAIVNGYSFRNRHPGSFLELLESGNMGIWHGGFPRPAIGNAQKEIDKSPEIKRIIQAELNK